jgi:hypothetical protein
MLRAGSELLSHGCGVLFGTASVLRGRGRVLR